MVLILKTPDLRLVEDLPKEKAGFFETQHQTQPDIMGTKPPPIGTTKNQHLTRTYDRINETAAKCQEKTNPNP